jgi:hypothetical protein
MGYLAWVSMSSLAAACYCVTGSPHQAPNLPSMAEGEGVVATKNLLSSNSNIRPADQSITFTIVVDTVLGYSHS